MIKTALLLQGRLIFVSFLAFVIVGCQVMAAKMPLVNVGPCVTAFMQMHNLHSL